jgi:Bacterial CdiA-CT RNAse A domain
MCRTHAISAILAIVCVFATGCQSTPREPAVSAPSSSSSPSSSAPRHDLSQDEDAGGHTLRKHVGRTDDQLRERLDRERNISAASTYTDREAAELAVGAALQQNRDKLQRWLDRQGRRPNLVLDYHGDPAHPIGRTLRSGEDRTQPCSHAVVVLRSMPQGGYYVLTSYPECR